MSYLHDDMHRTIEMIEDYTSSEDDENGMQDMASMARRGANVSVHPGVPQQRFVPQSANHEYPVQPVQPARGRSTHTPRYKAAPQSTQIPAYSSQYSAAPPVAQNRYPHPSPMTQYMPPAAHSAPPPQQYATPSPRFSIPPRSEAQYSQHGSTHLSRSQYMSRDLEAPRMRASSYDVAPVQYHHQQHAEYSPAYDDSTYYTQHQQYGDAPFVNEAPPQQHSTYSQQTYTSDVGEDGPSNVNPVQITNTDNLTPITQVDPGFRASFPFQFFNRMQSECFDKIYRSDGNICVAAPTSSGKTVLFKLAMIRVWEQYVNGKCIYIAPTKSLCQQKVREFSKMFSKTRKRAIVKEITGDTQETTVQDMLTADVIVTTPEKLDSVTRSWSTSRSTEQLMRATRLVCIDEVHLLNENRGHCLEALVSRLKSIAGAISHGMRVVAASATIPNLQDIGDWLGCAPDHRFAFGEEYRPVPLETHVIGYPQQDNQNMFVFQRNLSHKLFDLIVQYSEEKPSLVFCATRKETATAIDAILQDAESKKYSFVPDRMTQSILNTAASRIQNATLKKHIKQGCAHHSAGLSANDRSIVEELFLKGHVKVLCSTTTLALGVNLPARLVIVKGTQGYTQGTGYQEYDVLSILQMLGRSGRPQFDSVGRAVIMTTQDQQSTYDSLVHNQLEIESSFQKQIISHLNSEILCKSITDISEAITWIESTFYFVRIQKNPVHYGLESVKDVTDHIRTQVVQHLNDLEEYNLIEMDDTGQVSSTELGAAMSKFYISFETMVTLSGMTKDMSFEQVLHMLCRAHEFDDYAFRRGEKKVLNEINKNKSVAVYKVRGRITHVYQKVLLMLEAAFTDYKFESARDLATQVSAILRIAPRVARCMKTCAQVHKHYECLKHCITLEKCLKQSLWPDSKQLSRQLKGIGPVLSQKLANSGYTTIQKIASANPIVLDRIMGRQRLGVDIVKRAQAIPKFDVEYTIEEGDKASAGEVNLVVKVNRVFDDEPDEDAPATKDTKQRSKSFDNHYCIVVGNMSGDLVFFKRIDGNAVKKYSRVTIPLSKSVQANHRLEVRVISEMYIGVEYGTKATIPSIRAPAFSISPQQSGSAKKKVSAGNSTGGAKTKKFGPEDAQLSPLEMVREKAKTLPKTPASKLRKRLHSEMGDGSAAAPPETPLRKKMRTVVEDEADDDELMESINEPMSSEMPPMQTTPPAVQASPPAQKKRRSAPFSFPNAFQGPKRQNGSEGGGGELSTSTPAAPEISPQPQVQESPQSQKARALHDNLQAELDAEMEWCESLLKELSNELDPR